MNAKLLPKKLCNNLFNEISPKINLMGDASEITMNQNAIIDKNFIAEFFEYGLNNAKRMAECIVLKCNWIN